MYLNCHSYFSLRYGTLSPEALAREAHVRGVKVMALTDIHNTSCFYQFAAACEKLDIKAVYGIEFRDGDRFLYLGIAKNEEGIRELNEFLSRHSMSGEALPERTPDWSHCYAVYRRMPMDAHPLKSFEYIGIKPAEITPLSHKGKDVDKLVVFAPVVFLDETGWKTHKLLRCIDHNILLGKLEAHQHASRDECFLIRKK